MDRLIIRRGRPILAASLLMLLIAAVIHGQEPADRASEFVISFIESELQMNPIYSYTMTEAQIFTGLYEGLVSYHPLTMEPVPGVAERWEVSSDGLVYTFHLRRDARYSNGDPVLAEDFRQTWLTLLSPRTDAAYNFLFDVIAGVREYRSGENPDREAVGIRAIGPRTLEVVLRQPATHFLRILCHHAFVPVHPSVRSVVDWSDLETIPGNGAYRLHSRSTGEMLLVRNQHYWDASRVAIPRIRMRFFSPEDDQVTERFNNGEVDWVSSGMRLGEVLTPRTIVVNPLFATNYYFMQSRREPFNDPRIRRALTLLLPLDQIRDPELLFMPTDVLVPSIPFYPEVQGISGSDRDQALALLEDAGYPDGTGLPVLVVHIPDGQEPLRVAELMKDAWEEQLDVTTEIRVTPYSRYFDALKTRDFTVGTIGWIGDFADPLTFLQMWITDSNVNDAGFSDFRYDELIDRSMSLTGVARYNALGEAEEILLQTGTVIPVSHSPAINLIDLQAVDGWHPNPLDIHPLKYLRFTDSAPVPGVIRFDQHREFQLYSSAQ